MIDFMYSSALSKRYNRMTENKFNELLDDLPSMFNINQLSLADKVIDTKKLVKNAKELEHLALQQLRAHAFSQKDTPFLYWEDEDGTESITLDANPDGEKGAPVWYLTVVEVDPGMSFYHFYDYNQ